MRERTPEQKGMIQVGTALMVRGILLLGLAVLCFYLLVWLVQTLKIILLMLVISIFFCYLIAPIVRLFEQPVYVAGREVKLPRVAAIAVVYLLAGVLLFIALRLLLPLLWVQLTELARNLPEYATNSVVWVRKTLDDASSWMRQFKLPREWRDRILLHLSTLAEENSPKLGSVIGGIFGSLTYLIWLVIVPILSFFMLKDVDRFAKALVALMPTERLQKRAYWLLLDVSRTLAAYIRAQITACLEVGTLVTIGLLVMGVPYAMVLGVIAGVLEFIPMIGPVVAALIAFGLTLTTSSKMALGVALFLAALRIIQDYIIYPRIVGHGVKMHPLVVVLAILCGEKVGGLAGIFLAIPFVGLIIVFYNHYLAYRAIAAQASTATPRPAAAEAGLALVDPSPVPEKEPLPG